MIRGLHGLFYSSEPEALRAFLRDRLKLPHTDVGEGWLIFDLPETDLGVHPLDESGKPPSGTHDLSERQAIARQGEGLPGPEAALT
ncbi:MAG TPA: hypothetical protein VF815_10310 [Myxococcaceae bacterium]|jgi:hypothetical protein